MTAATVDLSDFALWRNGFPDELFADLPRTRPLFRHDLTPGSSAPRRVNHDGPSARPSQDSQSPTMRRRPTVGLAQGLIDGHAALPSYKPFGRVPITSMTARRASSSSVSPHLSRSISPLCSPSVGGGRISHLSWPASLANGGVGYRPTPVRGGPAPRRTLDRAVAGPRSPATARRRAPPGYPRRPGAPPSIQGAARRTSPQVTVDLVGALPPPGDGRHALVAPRGPIHHHNQRLPLPVVMHRDRDPLSSGPAQR